MSMIKAESLWEKYRIKFIIDGKVTWEEVWALEDVSLDVEAGEVVGVIGQNGAGKTTFLRLLAGVLVPDKGEVAVNGRVSAIMELGAGLNPEFTGRENILLNVRVYGIKEETLEQKVEEIIAFSNLGRFIDAPIKYYSQGMYMRLAFSLAIFVEPDILLIDDILAVGDEEAQQKCRQKIVELKRAGKTIILVSHDMGIINKLCDRVVLFDRGKLIKKGPPQEVVPYYLESVGEKTGIASLEEGGLRVVFNNGRVIVVYLQQHISSSTGGYYSLFDNVFKFHSPSTNLSWKVVSVSSSELAAEGRNSEEGDILESFRITLRDGALDIHVSSKGVSSKQHNFSLFLLPAYDCWSFSDQEGVFPGFVHRTNWHDFGVDIPSGEKLGIFSSSDNPPPGLVFETKSEGDILKIFNSGYEQESRIIHLSPVSARDLCLSFKVYPKKEDFENYLTQVREVLTARRLEAERLAREEAERLRLEAERLAREEAERLRLEEEAKRIEAERFAREEEARRLEAERLAREESERLRREEEAERREKERAYLENHTLKRGDYRLFVDKSSRCLKIYFQDKEITGLKGLNSIFCLYDGNTPRWCLTNNLDASSWFVEKPGPEELMIIFDFNFLKQRWHLSFKENGILDIKITINASSEFSVDNRFVRLELLNKYDLWETSHEHGSFSGSQYLNDILPVRLKNMRVCQAAVAAEKKCVPRAIFEVTGKVEQYVTAIFKQRQGEQEASCISFSPVLSWTERSLAPGENLFFEGRIIFDEQKKLTDKSYIKSKALIARGDLSFSFDRGRGEFTWKGKSLNKGLGVYTALRSQDIWYDSTQAAWKYIVKEKEHLVVEGQWAYIPVSQTWELKFISENSLRWEVRMGIYSRTSIEIEQASIMLREEYRRWKVENDIHGEFLDEFTRDYDILPFRYWYGPAGRSGLMAESDSLPRVTFINTTGAGRMPKGLLENSDYLYRSRIIQYQRCNTGALSPKKYAYFSGVIKIEDK